LKTKKRKRGSNATDNVQDKKGNKEHLVFEDMVLVTR
jgi:hypothetical protein